MIETEGKSVDQVTREIFEKLIIQGKPCYSPNAEACVYGDQRGNHCAVGWLLPDEPELMAMEGDVADLVSEWPIDRVSQENFDFILENKEFLKRLQVIHDNLQTLKFDGDMTDEPALDYVEQIVSHETFDTIRKWFAINKAKIVKIEDKFHIGEL